MSKDSASPNRRPYVVALTGGIASGKTLVSDEFARLGVPVIDMDVIAHAIVEPGSPALRAVIEAFGPDIVDSNGRLKRAELRTQIFADSGKRHTLESILHPVIRQEAALAVRNIDSPYCILVIPLLKDRTAYPYIDRVLVVDVDERTQVTRLMARDRCERQQADEALTSQINRNSRLALADDVLDNSISTDDAATKVARLHRKYLELANAL